MLSPGTLLRSAVRRLTAAAAIGLLLGLSALAVRPDLHHWLHADSGAADHQCAVQLFAGGVPVPALPAAVPAPSSAPAEAVAAPGNTNGAATAHYLRPPGRGPPAGEV